jgi:hypothetical protein
VAPVAGQHTQFALACAAYDARTPHPERHAPSPLLREDDTGMGLRQIHPNVVHTDESKDASRAVQESTRRPVRVPSEGRC